MYNTCIFHTILECERILFTNLIEKTATIICVGIHFTRTNSRYMYVHILYAYYSRLPRVPHLNRLNFFHFLVSLRNFWRCQFYPYEIHNFWIKSVGCWLLYCSAFGVFCHRSNVFHVGFSTRFFKLHEFNIAEKVFRFFPPPIALKSNRFSCNQYFFFFEHTFPGVTKLDESVGFSSKFGHGFFSSVEWLMDSHNMLQRVFFSDRKIALFRQYNCIK